MDGWLSDIRFGLRLLRRTPEVTAVAVLAMAIAIGVAGTVFSVANAILIQPLPFSEPERLVAIWQVDPANSATWRPAAPGNYADWQRMSQSFERSGAAVNISKTLTSLTSLHPVIADSLSPDTLKPRGSADAGPHLCARRRSFRSEGGHGDEPRVVAGAVLMRIGTSSDEPPNSTGCRTRSSG